MAISRTPMVDDDGTGTTGTVINNAWKQQLYDQIDAADASAIASQTPILENVPFNAANFSGPGGMTWTVEAADVTQFRFARVGKWVLIDLVLLNTVVGGTLSYYLIVNVPTLPSDFLVSAWNSIRIFPAGASASEAGLCQCSAGGKGITVFRNPPGANFGAGNMQHLYLSVATYLA